MGVGEESTAPVTISDVARAAGVAPSTVSRAFSRPGRV
ncbi:MAG TPA: LacI family transcriptional regulator, partial [Cutibacterium acnes]|nr:LacI family transcriptional regulator [Cutibacterium acnes]